MVVFVHCHVCFFGLYISSFKGIISPKIGHDHENAGKNQSAKIVNEGLGWDPRTSIKKVILVVTVTGRWYTTNQYFIHVSKEQKRPLVVGI